jgi:hypothetical protein
MKGGPQLGPHSLSVVQAVQVPPELPLSVLLPSPLAPLSLGPPLAVPPLLLLEPLLEPEERPPLLPPLDPPFELLRGPELLPGLIISVPPSLAPLSKLPTEGNV